MAVIRAPCSDVIGIEYCFVQLCVQDLWHQLSDQLVFGGFEDEVAFLGTFFLLYFRDGEEAFYGVTLHGGIAEFAVH